MSRPTDAAPVRAASPRSRARPRRAAPARPRTARPSRVVQRRALAADRLGDQEALAALHADHRRRVELHELQVRQRRARRVRQQQAHCPASRAGWWCAPTSPPPRRCSITTARARDRRTPRRGPRGVSPRVRRLTPPRRQRGRRRGRIQPQRPRARVLQHRDPRLLHRQRRQLRAAGAGPWRCRRRARRAAPSGRPPGPAPGGPKRSASKRTPSACRSCHALRRLAHQHLRRRAAHRAAARALGVPQMQLRAVVLRQRRREPALRPVARRLRQRRRRDQRHASRPPAPRTAPRTGPPRPRPRRPRPPRCACSLLALRQQDRGDRHARGGRDRAA